MTARRVTSTIPHDVDDAALLEALAKCADSGRLTNAQVSAMRSKRRQLASAGIAAVLLTTSGLWYSRGTPPSQVQIAHLETQRGEQRAFRLRDGSTVRLGGATSLNIRFEAGHRHAVLSRGQAYFDIAHDRTRPFDVAAGPSNTRVLGTAFDIDIAGNSVKLAVYRGQVQFGPQNAAHDHEGVVVPAGWRSHFRGSAAGTPTRFDRTSPDWRDGWLDTDAMQLGAVVDTLNRGSGPLIAPPPKALADIQLAGRFKLDKSRQLLEAIGEVYGFTVHQDGNRLRLQANGSS